MNTSPASGYNSRTYAIGETYYRKRQPTWSLPIDKCTLATIGLVLGFAGVVIVGLAS